MTGVTRIAGGGLRVTALEIRNLWGVKEALIRPGKRNIIRGPNGTGKSSLLNAIQLALGGGTLGKYQRVGTDYETEPPQIVLEISGPGDFVRVEREGDKPPRVLRRIGESEALEKIPAPATFLKGLFDVRGSNPFAFLLASDDERAQLLLEALEIQMDEGALADLLGKDGELAASVPATLHPLIRLALIHDAIFSARRACNVEAEGKRKAAAHLRRSVPAERLQDLGEEIADLESLVGDATAGIARREEAAKSTAANTIGAAATDRSRAREKHTAALVAETKRIRSDHELWAETARADLEREISAREREVGRVVEALSATTAQRVAEVHLAQDEIISVAEETRDAELTAIAVEVNALRVNRERLAQLREQQKEAARHENTRVQIAEFERVAFDHETDSERLTGVLSGIASLKRRLAESLPVAGLDVSGKEIRVNGVPWAQLNKGQQGAIAGIVAVERAKKQRLPIVFFDEAERFDEAHLNAIADVVAANDAQLFAAVVARDGELTVEADGEMVGAVKIDAPKDPTSKTSREKGSAIGEDAAMERGRR